jgi:hypothetical protein
MGHPERFDQVEPVFEGGEAMTGGSTSVIQTDGRPLFGLRPYVNESFFGFTARLATWNHFDSRRRFLRQIGFEHLRREGLDAALENPGPMSWLLRLSEDELARLTAGGDSEGEAYRRTIQSQRRRISPASLRKAGYHRAAWAQKLPFCTESWEVLIDECPSCRAGLGWSMVLDIEICERCGFDLRGAYTHVVPESARKSLLWLASLIEPPPSKSTRRAEIPQQISGFSRFEIFELVECLALTKRQEDYRAGKIDAKPIRSKFELSLTDAKYLAFGAKSVERYPDSFDELTGGRFIKNSKLGSFFTTARHTGSPQGIFLFNLLYDDWEPCRHGPVRLLRLRQESGQLSLREAARRLQVSNHDLRILLDQDLIPAAAGRGAVRKIQWLEPTAIDEAGKRLKDRMSLHEFSQTFQIPTYGAAQLIALGVLTINEDPIVNAIHHGVQLGRSAAEALTATLRNICRVPVPAIPVLPLEDVFQGIGAQEKPWGAIIQAALQREISIYHSDDLPPRISFKALQVSRELAVSIVARTLPGLLEVPDRPNKHLDDVEFSRLDVERYLNCFPRDLSWLVEAGHLRVPFIPTEVAKLAATIISSREISWRWRISPTLRNVMATDYGIQRTLGPFWSRSQVEGYFSARWGASAAQERRTNRDSRSSSEPPIRKFEEGSDAHRV